MKSSDTEFLAASSDVLSCQHSGVGGGLVAVRFDFHAAGDAGDGFAAAMFVSVSIPRPHVYARVFAGCRDVREISNVHKGIIEAGEDAGDAEDELALADLGTEGDVFLRRALNLLLGCHVVCRC